MKMAVDETKIAIFQKKIFDWWKQNRRDFPWRDTVDPYYILVSEMMLQQTQTTRVIPKYEQFIAIFPTIEALANAEVAEVIKLWSGLGYNRRAIYLHNAVKELVLMRNFPSTPKEMEAIKGIGKYTARAILIFAFNHNLVTVDTNIRRIFIHEGFATEKNTEKELYQIAEKLLPLSHSRDWHNALMDYGSIVLTASSTGIKPVSTQPTFKGSKRMYRGKVLKSLITKEKMTRLAISNECSIPKSIVDEILEDLIRERLIKKDRTHYSLPS